MFAKSKQPSGNSSTNNLDASNETGKNAQDVLSEFDDSSDGTVLPPKVKSPPSLLSIDLFIKGNLNTQGDIQIEGSIDGNIKASLLTVGQGAVIKGEINADEVVINGRVSGTIRGEKVHLTSSAKVEGDIIHKSIAIESGAHFEGSIEKSSEPLKKEPKTKHSSFN